MMEYYLFCLGMWLIAITGEELFSSLWFLSYKNKVKEIKRNPIVIKDFPIQNEELCIQAVKKDPDCIERIRKPSKKVILTAMKTNHFSFFQMKDKWKTIDMCVSCFMTLDDNESILFLMGNLPYVKYIKVKENKELKRKMLENKLKTI